MKTRSYLWLLTLLLFIHALPGKTQHIKYSVDTLKSTMNWTGYYVFNFGSHHGTVNITNGEFYVLANQVIRGSFDIDMRSIENLDMKGEDGELMLEEHLKSDDFFSADKFPKAHFEIGEIERMEKNVPGKPNYKIRGKLTIKDITNPVEFSAAISITNDTLTASAKFKFDRTKWDIRYNSGRFFDDVGDGAISDGIGMEIEITAYK